MTPPLSTGTLLRQRYEIQQVLGQGGFGRTYLALDQERFAEPCVVKEFLVPYHDPILIEKSKTLFQREASILHQIQHPQIPRFWAAFEDEQRLFLVQDFIAGKTYRQILEERKSQGKTFSEAEVLEFLNSLLPVLTYIHDRAIIHRDITPENIILHCPDRPSEASRSQGLPVLIDFGAVKEATTHWPLLSNPTQVGKVGYAPTEQLQTGTVHPSSDLYALAATSLALLTGKEPRVLLDSQTLSWCWQAHTRVSPALEQILHRMLAMYPGDRYESAREVLTELQPLLQAIPAETRLYIPRTEATTPAPQETSLPLEDKHSSQQHSIPRPETALPATALPKAEQFPLNRRQRAIAASVVATLGVATPILWQFQQKPPTPPIDGEVASAPSASHSLPLTQGITSALNRPSSSGTASPPVSSNPPIPVQFAPGKAAIMLEGKLQAAQMQPYLLEASAGQIMTASLVGEGVTMNLLRSNQEAVDAAAYQTRNWTGQLPVSERYLIQVAGSGNYTLELAITPQVSSMGAPLQRISFARGSHGTTVTGSLTPTQTRRYLIKAQAGQILALKVLEGRVSFSTIAPSGQRIGGSATNSNQWQGRLPTSGDYIVEITTRQPDDYALLLEVF